MATKRLDNKSPAQRQWATINNINATAPAPRRRGTPRQETARTVIMLLGLALRDIGDQHGLFARLGMEDARQDLVQRIDALQAAALAAGEETE